MLPMLPRVALPVALRAPGHPDCSWSCLRFFDACARALHNRMRACRHHLGLHPAPACMHAAAVVMRLLTLVLTTGVSCTMRRRRHCT